jgi:serine/threonine protein kinase
VTPPSTANQPPGSRTTVHHAALVAGRRIGRYEILGVLGQGGFGITYRARDTQLGRDVAVKEYLPTALAVRQDGTTVLPRSTDLVDDFVWGRDRFIAEGHTLASLEEAPAIVRVFDFLEANGTAYIVMELLRGETLEARLNARGPLSPAEVDAILRPLLDGLEHVHTAGFLHRDIKPANILLKANGAPTLIDFGASRAAIAGRTAAMTAIFTPGYAAAEQFTSAKQGPWSDIYGLAATIHCAIIGQPPPSAFDRMLDDDYRPLVRVMPAGFAPSLLKGIDAGLAVRAADRPQSIAQWRTILNDTSDVTMVSRSRPAPAQPSATAPSVAKPAAGGGKRQVALYAGAALAVVLLAIGGWFALSPSSPQRGALQDMKVEDLERALAERRKADAETAEKRRLEEAAQRKAAADALAKQAADAELERAQAERQKAEQELTRVKAELEAQLKAAAAQRDQAEAVAQRAAAEEAERKAQAEADARRQAEEEARRKAATEAQAKQQADEALAKAQAERRKAEEEARLKAEAEARQMADATAKQKADAEAAEAAAAKAAQQASEAADKKAAEVAEAVLKLAPVDRQRLQAALTSLGFDTRGTDGAFGPRSREMIAGWQKARNQPPTGYVNAAQQQALLREGAAAVGKFDDEQKKLEDKKADEAKKKAEDEAKNKAKAAAAAPAAAGAAPAATAAPGAPAAAPAGGGFDGVYGGGLYQNASGGMGKIYTVMLTSAGGRATGEAVYKTCGSLPIALSVSPSGDISGPFQLTETGQQVCAPLTSQATGRVSNGKVEFEVRSAGVSARGSLTKR